MLSTCTFDERPSPHVRTRRWHNPGPRLTYACSAHDAYEVALVEAGTVEYRVGTRLIELGADAAIVVPAGTEHATSPGKEARASSVWIDRAWMDELGGVLGKKLRPDPIVLRATRQVRSLLSLLFEEAMGADVGRMLAVESLAELLGLTIYRTDGTGDKAGGGPMDPRVLAAMDLAEQRYGDSIGVDEMASAAGLSRFHFSRLFREQVGVSPYRFLLRTRLRRAAELLRSGPCAVTEAALSVGFNDLSRFSRAFRAEFGLVPSAVAGR